MIDETAVQAILDALLRGPLEQPDLEQELRDAGQADAIEVIIPAARAGRIAARDVFDEDGNYLYGEFATPDDAFILRMGGEPQYAPPEG
jgi:hypothetical protein